MSEPAMISAHAQPLGNEPPSTASHGGVGSVLRALGAALLVASASTFLFQHWADGSDLARYCLLLAHALALTATGVLCATKLGEPKSARTLLGTVLATLPVHFGVLGGLLYSRLGPMVGEIPDALHWNAPSTFSAVAITATALALLVPVCWFALRVFAQGHAGRLTCALLASHALLLVPSRHGALVCALAFGCMEALLQLDARMFADKSGLHTREGRFVRALLFAPVALLVGRSLWLYAPTTAFLAASCLLAARVWFALAPQVSKDVTVAGRVQAFAMLPALLGCSLLSGLLDGPLAPYRAQAFAFSLLLALWWMSTRALSGPGRYLVVAGVTGCAVLGFDLCDAPLGPSALALAFGCAAGFAGVVYRRLSCLGAGVALATAAAVRELWFAFGIPDLSHWGTLSVLGVVLIVSAAVLERHAARFARGLAQLGQGLRAYEL